MNLTSRYGEIWEFTEIPDGYLWKPPGHTRIGLFPDSHEDISFIDPPGGPFLEVGREIRKGEIIISIQEEQSGEIKIKVHKKEG